MPRELRHEEWVQKTQKEFQLDLKEWKELKRELAHLQNQVQNTEQKLLLAQAKMVKFFDILTQKLEKQDVKKEELKHFVEDQIQDLRLKIEKNQKNQEHIFSHKLQDLIEKTHQSHQKNSFQIKDLCQSLTHHSEQIWGLKDQVEEIKKNENLEKDS